MTIENKGLGITVGDLEAILLKAFPKEDAEEWDYTGLRVGDPNQEVTGIAITLDPTVESMEKALEAGANVLISHHPLFLEPPTSFLPFEIEGQTPGSAIYFALTHGLACMNFHTACDVSVQGLKALPERLGLRYINPLLPLANSSEKGFGAVCAIECMDKTQSVSLASLAIRTHESLGVVPRVWGDENKVITSVVCCGGSASFLLKDCLKAGIDCLICGEVKYHDCLDAYKSGLSIIELGHDYSEYALCDVLEQTLLDESLDASSITIINQEKNWSIPELASRTIPM
ncbi:MAG: Nif3-like dinuclear metal center hexameric protein [Anaerotardibacter sp.]